jgi:competence protein ComEC
MSFQVNEFKRFIQTAPFLKILLPFGLGIFIHYQLNNSIAVSFLITLVFSFLTLFTSQFLPNYYQLKFNFVKGILLSFVVLSIGYLVSYAYSIQHRSAWYVAKNNKYTHAVVRINSEIEAKEKSFKTIVAVQNLLNDSSSIHVQGDAIIYFKKSNTALDLHYGDEILILNKFKPITSSTNPGSFDYAAYSHRNQIFESAYLADPEWKKTGKHATTFLSICNQGNQWIRTILKKYITDSTTIGLAEALLVGYRKDMDDDLSQAYSNAGIVHIVAISGMHIALVYTSVIALLSLSTFLKKRRYIQIISALLFMWLFACITGLPASVTRAAVMLSFMAVGELFNRKMSIYNNLAISAFVLLCFNPAWLFDVGFQLSYLAILSLVVFYEPIYNWVFVSNKCFNSFWKLIAGTIAAQILTFPLCIYYFHQFPIIFLITNIIAVPITTLIIFAEIILLFISFVTPLASFLGKCISASIYWLNEIVIKMSQWAFSVIGNLNFEWYQLIFIYGFIFFCSLWMLKKYSRALILSLTCLLLFITSQIDIRFQTLHQKKMVVFQSPKISSTAFFTGEEATLLQHDSVSRINSFQKYALLPALNALHVTNTTIDTFHTNSSIEWYSFSNKTIAFIHSSKFQAITPIVTDYAIISKYCQPDSAWLFKNINAKQIILDASVPDWKAEKWKLLVKQSNIPVHCTNTEGAFVINLSE